jgi:hypothetical protein
VYVFYRYQEIKCSSTPEDNSSSLSSNHPDVLRGPSTETFHILSKRSCDMVADVVV